MRAPRHANVWDRANTASLCMKCASETIGQLFLSLFTEKKTNMAHHVADHLVFLVSAGALSSLYRILSPVSKSLHNESNFSITSVLDRIEKLRESNVGFIVRPSGDGAVEFVCGKVSSVMSLRSTNFAISRHYHVLMCIFKCMCAFK